MVDMETAVSTAQMLSLPSPAVAAVLPWTLAATISLALLRPEAEGLLLAVLLLDSVEMERVE